MSNTIKIRTFNFQNPEAVSLAEKESRLLWAWGMLEKYKELNREELAAQLEEFGTKLKQAGASELKFVKLIDDKAENMPSDARVELLYKPTYVALAVYIYAYTQYSELFEDTRYLVWLQELLTAAQGRKLLGHGYEAKKDWLDNLWLFSKAGAQQFVEEPPAGAEAFCTMLKEYIAELQADVAQCQKQNEPYCIQGFGKQDVDAEAKMVLALWQ